MQLRAVPPAACLRPVAEGPDSPTGWGRSRPVRQPSSAGCAIVRDRFGITFLAHDVVERERRHGRSTGRPNPAGALGRVGSEAKEDELTDRPIGHCAFCGSGGRVRRSVECHVQVTRASDAQTAGSAGTGPIRRFVCDARQDAPAPKAASPGQGEEPATEILKILVTRRTPRWPLCSRAQRACTFGRPGKVRGVLPG